jgi:Recombinase
MFAEYEKAPIMERYRRGKAHRARTGSISVLSGAPSVTATSARTSTPARPTRSSAHGAALVAELFRRYADDGASIADLARWLTAQHVPTRTGKHRWGPLGGLGRTTQPGLRRPRRVRQDHDRARIPRPEPSRPAARPSPR